MENGVFVKIDDYKDVLDVIGLIKDKVSHAKSNVEKIKSIKEREDAELNSWSTRLAEIESKVGEMDKVLLHPSI
jgi:hypothetical protein